MNSNFAHTILAGLVLFASLSLASGCAILGPSGPTVEQANAAHQAGELEKLSRWCEQLDSMDKNLASADGAKTACAKEKSLRRERARDSQLEAYVAGLSCDGVTDSYVEFQDSDPRPSEIDVKKAFAASGKKLASCDKFDELFSELLAREVKPVSSDRTKREGYELLQSLADEEGVAVHEKIVEFSSSNTFEFDKSYHTADAIVTFLFENELKDGCETYLDTMESNQVGTVKQFMTYFGWTECRAAGDAIAGYLKTSENWELRKHACFTLGRIGDPAHEEIMSKVAENDSEMYIEQQVKVYPVRDECSGALVKLDDH